MAGFLANPFVVFGGFSPLIYSPALWLDAVDSDTITESSGLVSQWDDKSGNNNHATQGTAAAQPTYTSGVKLDFDGTNDFLTLSGVSAQCGFFVVRNANDTVATLISDSTGASYVFLRAGSSDYSVSVDGSSANTGDITINGGTLTPGDGSGTNISVSGYVPFPTRDQSDIVYFQLDQAENFIEIARASSFYGNLDIQEIILYPTSLATAPRQAVEAYLAARWQ